MTTKAVNKPVNLKAKEADINAKLQLFGIYSGRRPIDSSRVDRHAN
jgi:hypothetical protein